VVKLGWDVERGVNKLITVMRDVFFGGLVYRWLFMI
jgi:hypothetical protein